MQNAYPQDELNPIECKGISRDSIPENLSVNDVLGGFSLSLIDSLDSLCILGMQDEFERMVKKVVATIHFDLDVRIQVFEVTIRVLGGLLSAHLLATDSTVGCKIAGYNRELLDLAIDLGDRLLPAFRTPTGIPYPRYGVEKNESTETCTAGAGTLILEFGVLSRLSNNSIYENAAKLALLKVWKLKSNLNLIGSTMSILEDRWIDQNSGIGASIDSFFEYLLKAHILLGGDEYLDIFNQAYAGVKKHIVDSSGFVYMNVNMFNARLSSPWIDSLAAYFSGLQVLSGDIAAAVRPHLLYFYIWEKYNSLPERFNFQTRGVEISNYPLRPELVESTYMLYQSTKNDFYLEAGATILRDLQKYCRVPCGFAGLSNVETKTKDSQMHSFFLAETLKYLYLLFDKDNIINTIDSNALFTSGNLKFTKEGHYLPLPYKYTDLRGSRADNQTCMIFEQPWLNGMPPMDPVWAQNLKLFVGSRDLNSELEFGQPLVKSLDLLSIVYDFFRGIPITILLSVIFIVYNALIIFGHYLYKN